MPVHFCCSPRWIGEKVVIKVRWKHLSNNVFNLNSLVIKRVSSSLSFEDRCWVHATFSKVLNDEWFWNFINLSLNSKYPPCWNEIYVIWLSRELNFQRNALIETVQHDQCAAKTSSSYVFNWSALRMRAHMRLLLCNGWQTEIIEFKYITQNG